MPNVLATPTALQDKTCQLTYKVAHPQSMPRQTPWQSLRHLFASLRALLTPQVSYSLCPTSKQLYRSQAFESPVDRLARQDPYIFIKSMCG
jgi:hypothetical protein